MTDFDITGIIYDEDSTFDPFEAPAVVREYVCAICHGQLVQHYLRHDRRILIVCPEHGNVATSGRVMVSSVGIEMERSKRDFPRAIRNLPDLWGELIPPKKSDKEIVADLGF